MADDIRSGLGPFAIPRQVNEAIEPTVARRSALLAELAELDRIAHDLAASRLRAGSRGTAADISAPTTTGRTALDECIVTISSLETRLAEVRNAGMRAAR